MSKISWLVGNLGCIALLIHASPAGARPSLSGSTPDTEPQPISASTLCPSDCPEEEDNGLGVVRSVAELADVLPSDWAYQALKSLIERYGVSVGYPDGKFRGNQALTRNEFAAALALVMERLEELVATGQIAQLQEDVTTLRRLQAAYGTIASNLNQRLDRLDRQTVQLRQRQFSSTTKLSGQTVLALTDGTNTNATVIARTRLDLRTSFSGSDLLMTQLEAGNNGQDGIGLAHNRRQNLLGTTGLLADGGGADYIDVPDRLRLSKLYYSFQPIPSLSITVGARLNPRDFIDGNPFANDSARTFTSSFFSNNPLIVQNSIDRPGGAGAVVTWRLESLPLTLRALYAAAEGDRPEAGLFGDRNQRSLELEYNFTRNLALRLQYTGATIDGTRISAAGLNASWALNPNFAVFGRFGFGRYNGFNSTLNQDLDYNPKTWALGFFVRRLVIPGSTAGLAIGQPFVDSKLGNATQTNFEAFYSFFLNDNISFTPALLVVTNPNNNRDRGNVWEWLIRMVYTF